MESNNLEVGGISYKIISTTNEETNGKTFGVKIGTAIFGEAEEEIIPDISTDMEFTRRMVEALAEGFVTPFHAREVIENYLVEYL